jgi:hypothetical protein
MSPLLFTINQKWSNDIPYTIRYKYCSSHETLLRRSRHVTGTQRNRQAHYRPKEADQRVSDNRSDGAVAPGGFPDRDETGDCGESAEEEHGDAVPIAGGEVSGQGDTDGADEAKGKLEENRL